MIRDYHDNPQTSPTEAYHYYARLGMMTIKAGMEGEVDTMLRRSNFKMRHGLAETVDLQAIWARTVTAEEAGRTAPVNGKKRPKGEDASLSIPFAHMMDAEEDEAQDTAGPSCAPS